MLNGITLTGQQAEAVLRLISVHSDDSLSALGLEGETDTLLGLYIELDDAREAMDNKLAELDI